MKNYQKNSIYPSVPFSCMKNRPIHAVYMKIHLWHLKGLILELHLNLWFKWISPKLNAKCIGSKQHHIYMPWSCIILLHMPFYWLSTPFLLDRSCSGECSRVPVWGAVPPYWSTRQANPLCSFRYNPTLSLLLSFTALGQQRFNCYFMLR